MQTNLNFRQLKYILPIIFLPGLLVVGYIMLPLSKSGNVTNQKFKSEDKMITDIQQAEEKIDQTKFENLKNEYKRIFDTTRTTVQMESGNEDTIENTMPEITNTTTNEEKQESPYYTDWQQFGEDDDDEENTNVVNRKKLNKEEEIELFKKQLRQLDSLKHPEAYNTPGSEYQKHKTDNQYETNEDVNTIEQTPELKQTVQKLEKETGVQNEYFNTINAPKFKEPIKAILDEMIKVNDGSRVKIRLLDNVTIGNTKLPKGYYLYGKVTGFSDERVKINITSILTNGQIIKVNIAVYDNDGQEGFYVPKSAFRDASKQAGSQISSQGVNINNRISDNESAKGVATQFGLQALQNLYNTSSQTLARAIRKNRALLKYASFVYLINQDEEQGI